MQFGQILVLLLAKALYEVGVGLVSDIAFDESFLEVHDVLVGGLLKPENVNSSEERVLGPLHKLELVLEVLLLLD